MREFVLLLIAFALAGCTIQQAPPTPTPLQTPSPTLAASANATPTTSTPNATATSTPTPTSSPTVTLTPECTISVNPNDAQGPFRAGVSARFVNADPGNGTVIKCTAKDSGVSGERKEGGFYFRTCDYPDVQTRTLETASASGAGASCSTLVVIQTNPLFSKSWTFSPDGESFTMNKSVSNTTTRNYTITNAGNSALESFSCNSDKSFVTVSCPPKIAVGANAPFNATFSISAQANGQQSVLLTVKEKDLQKDFSISLTIVS